MYKFHCLNPIAHIGLENFTDNYTRTEDIKEADGILVRSATMHDLEIGDNVLAVARAGAGTNNIPVEKYVTDFPNPTAAGQNGCIVIPHLGASTEESALFHRNVANMISQFTTVLGEAGINISDMTNKSRGDVAYTMMTLESKVSNEIVEKLSGIDGVYRVRVVK